MEGFNLSGRNKGLVSVSTTVQDESTEEGMEGHVYNQVLGKARCLS